MADDSAFQREITRIWTVMDGDRSGTIDKNELRSACRLPPPEWSTSCTANLHAL